MACRAPHQQRGPVEREYPGPRMHAESDCRGFDADADIVLLVLMRVDRVIADRPEHASDVQQQWRPGERAGDGGPADARSPIEIEAQKNLWPIRDALHKRICADQPENGSPEQ